MATRKRTPKKPIQTVTEGIQYDPETRDFAVYLDGELIGFARSYREGDAMLNAVKSEIAKLRKEGE